MNQLTVPAESDDPRDVLIARLRVQLRQLGGQFAEVKQQIVVHEGVIRELRHRAEREPTTNLLRKEVVDMEIARVLGALDADELARTAILYFDIDDFGEFNKSFGHDEGDTVLRYVADIIRANLRPGDFAGRGDQGDEFVLLLRDSSVEEALLIGETICSGIERRKRDAVTIDGEMKSYHINVSVGVAACPSSETTFREWKELADLDMLRRKKAKKDAKE